MRPTQPNNCATHFVVGLDEQLEGAGANLTGSGDFMRAAEQIEDVDRKIGGMREFGFGHRAPAFNPRPILLQNLHKDLQIKGEHFVAVGAVVRFERIGIDQAARRQWYCIGSQQIAHANGFGRNPLQGLRGFWGLPAKQVRMGQRRGLQLEPVQRLGVELRQRLHHPVAQFAQLRKQAQHRHHGVDDVQVNMRGSF